MARIGRGSPLRAFIGTRAPTAPVNATAALAGTGGGGATLTASRTPTPVLTFDNNNAHFARFNWSSIDFTGPLSVCFITHRTDPGDGLEHDHWMVSVYDNDASDNVFEFEHSGGPVDGGEFSSFVFGSNGGNSGFNSNDVVGDFGAYGKTWEIWFTWDGTYDGSGNQAGDWHWRNLTDAPTTWHHHVGLESGKFANALLGLVANGSLYVGGNPNGTGGAPYVGGIGFIGAWNADHYRSGTGYLGSNPLHTKVSQLQAIDPSSIRVGAQLTSSTPGNIVDLAGAGVVCVEITAPLGGIGIHEFEFDGVTPTGGGTAAGHGGGAARLTAAKSASSLTATSGGGAPVVSTRKNGVTTVSLAGGGSGALTSTSTNIGLATGGGGGTATLAATKAATGAVSGTGGGTATVSAVKTPQPGGVLWTGMFGGGGRIGRSHPAQARFASVVPMNATSPVARSGSVVGTGGGQSAGITEAKGAQAVTVEFNGIPPIFLDTFLGVRSHGGGAAATTYTRTQARVGVLTGSGGGGTALAARKNASTATVSATGGGASTLTTRRNAFGALTNTGGGAAAITYVLSESRSGVVSGTGGGTAATTRLKTGIGLVTGTGGGQSSLRLARQVAGATTGTAGGSATITAAAAGPIASFSLTVTGGGTARLAAKRGATVAVSASVGGASLLTHTRATSGTTSGTGGGGAIITRIAANPPTHAGRVNPRTRTGRVAKDELSGVPLILRR